MSATPDPLLDNDHPSERVHISQADVPRYTLDQALVIPETISRQYAKQPTRPLYIAIALNQKPKSGHFRYLCGAAQAYGLTDGGPRVEKIGLTELGRRIVAPTREGDDLVAKREGLMQPRVMREFLTRYNGSPLPSRRIALNVLDELGVPQEATERTFDFIVDSARGVGLLRELKGDLYVDLDALPITSPVQPEPADDDAEPAEGDLADVIELSGAVPDQAPTPSEKAASSLAINRKVFITRGRTKHTVVDQLKELLVFEDFEPVLSVERETVSKPVPDKVMDDMRQCAASVIHVGTETKVIDQDGQEHRVLNPNVLIEIGAAMALYGRKFILLVEEETTLPSNLQGLYEVRYHGSELDHTATMSSLKLSTTSSVSPARGAGDGRVVVDGSEQSASCESTAVRFSRVWCFSCDHSRTTSHPLASNAAEACPLRQRAVRVDHGPKEPSAGWTSPASSVSVLRSQISQHSTDATARLLSAQGGSLPKVDQMLVLS